MSSPDMSATCTMPGPHDPHHWGPGFVWYCEGRTAPALADSLRRLAPVGNSVARLLHPVANRLDYLAAQEAKLPTVTCPTCGGTGKILISSVTVYGERLHEAWKPCPDCGRTCPTCNGEAQVCDPETGWMACPDCPDGRCDHGTVQLTLADAVAQCVALHDLSAYAPVPQPNSQGMTGWEQGWAQGWAAAVEHFRSVRA